MKSIVQILKTVGIKKMFLLVLIIVVYSLCSFIPIKYIEQIIDSIGMENAVEALKQIIEAGILYMLFQFLSQFFYAVYNFYGDRLQNQHARDLRIRTFQNLLEADELYVKKTDYSKLSNVIIEDTQYIGENYYDALVVCIVSVVNFVIGFIFMTSISLYLSLLIIPLGLVTSFCSKKIENMTEKNLDEQKKATEKAWKLYGEGIRGIKNIKLFDSENRYLKVIKAVSSDLCCTNIKQSRIEKFGGCIIGTFYMCVIGIVMFMSAIFVLKGWISFGGLLALVMYNHMLVDPLLNLIEVRQKIMRLDISVERINGISALKKLEKERSNVGIEEIRIEQISFAYDTKKIFSDFSYCFKKGRIYCIAGRTGQGKSTLLNLIMGYLTPAAGDVAVVTDGGEVIKNKIWERVSYLQQGGYLFNMTIEDNIRFANSKLEDEQLKRLIWECCLSDVCDRVKGNIGDDGRLLSGGERKRVQLAVCLAKSQSDVLIFDELSSGLDRGTYDEIIGNIKKYFDDKIVIFIEHYNIESELYDEVIRL